VEDKHILAGDFHFGGGGVRALALLGTCVAIMAWHPARKIGGICHFLLPSRPQGNTTVHAPGMYADGVMGLFETALSKTQTLASDYVIKVAGGGNMFPDQSKNSGCRAGNCDDESRTDCRSIGCNNIKAARSLLDGAGFSIASESVGGHGSRQVIFNLSTGDVFVRRGTHFVPNLRAAS
jgi:chemotaxis protein CheD